MRDYPFLPETRYGRAVFIDRDGTINIDTHYPHKLEDLILIPEALEGLRLLSKLPLNIIVISNQAGIALNMYDTKQMSLFNTAVRERVSKFGGRIDAFYYCPHQEQKNLQAGEETCRCSKPLPGMLFEAAGDYHINLLKSFLIGDRLSDIAAGKAAECTTFLVKTGAFIPGKTDLDVAPDFIVDDLLQASLKIETQLNGDFENKSRPAHERIAMR